jgi:D-alanyl-lipoteichoic acid acyltransferase DltB (MBOAT superfamily)
MEDTTIWLLIAPILLIHIALIIRNLIHISKKTKTKYLNKTVWILIMVCIQFIGNIAYILVEGENDDSD